jgi:hypothetical protein
MNYK